MLLHEFLEQSARLFPNKTALICGGNRFTFADIDNQANSLASSLIDEEIHKQDRVIIFLENSAELVVSLYGVLKAGGIFVILNPQIKPLKLAYILADCRAGFLITDLKRFKQISGAIANNPYLRNIIITDYENDSNLNGINSARKLRSFQLLIKTNKKMIVMPTCIDIDLASLIYTSGSTGNPKGVMLTHLNMVSAVNSITQYLGNTFDDIIIDTLPLAFDYGLYQILMAFKFGGTVVLEKGFIFPEQIIKQVIQEKVTGWPIVPTVAAILCRLKNIEKHDFSKVRYITSTGQVLPPNHIARLKEIFPQAKIFSMYGLTECKRVSYLPPEETGNRPGSVGKAMPNTEVYIVDNEGQEIKEPGKIGQLVVRGSNVMRGYWNLPEETRRALRPGRYPGENALFTGDLFKKDDQDYLYFIGRMDDIIKTSGHMVSPKEVENVLYKMEDVIEAAVIGVPDEILGQSVKAFLHLTEGSKLTEKNIRQFCHEYLEDYAVPASIVFCGPLPKSENGKIQKRDLK